MVDIGDRKDDDSSKKKKKKKKKTKKSKSSSSGGGSSGSSNTEPFEMGDEAIPDVDDAQVSDVSKEWSQDGAELNVSAGASGSTKKYIQRQITECEEFYDDFATVAEDNMEDINQFTLYFHAITLGMARNRLGIKRVLEDRFNKSEAEAVEITGEICERAGEMEAYNRILDALTKRLEEE